MGWKNLKEHYGIEHIVHLTEEGVLIGTPADPAIIVVGFDGVIKRSNRDLDEDFARYHKAIASDPLAALYLIELVDVFSHDITVYTYRGDEVVAKKCESLGWPNVTHDGRLMYVNTFSSDKEQVALWIKANAAIKAAHAKG